MDGLSEEELIFLINHLFLPPRLPQEDDQAVSLDEALLQLVTEALSDFGDLVPEESRSIVHHVHAAICQLIKTRNDTKGVVDEQLLHKALEKMSEAGSPFTIPLHISAQNAGVIFSRHQDGILYEAFEVSPLNSAVTGTQGRLRRCFPGPVLCIEKHEFEKPGLLSTLAQTLSKMSFQRAVGMTPTVSKSGNEVEETRDTIHPGLVTELIPAYLQPLSTITPAHRIWKNTREEVLWEDSLLPWRRSPLWLFVRTVMQLMFTRFQAAAASEPAAGDRRCLYKLFMVYLFATVLSGTIEADAATEPDTLSCMSAKIHRRLLKLKPEISDPGIVFVQDVLKMTKLSLKDKWSEIQESDSRDLDLDNLKSLKFSKHVSLSLPELDEFISSIPRRGLSSHSVDFSPSPDLLKLPSSSLPASSLSTSTDYMIYNLSAFEHWVAFHLSMWLEGNVKGHDTCTALKALMEEYNLAAEQTYHAENPETSSIKLLTLLELWIACDKSAVALFPMLRDYDPDIQVESLQSLVLPLKEHMVRLLEIEEYLHNRRNAACRGTSGSIFQDFGTADCFSVRYYDTSPKHQELLQKIQTDAEEKRRRKCEELTEKKARYHTIMNEYHQSHCEWYDVTDKRGRTRPQHASYCGKCALLERAESITINVHEWPLPLNKLAAKSVVFELDAPESFGAWKDATMFLHLDVLKATYGDSPQAVSGYSLESYDALKHHFRSGETRRLGLLSVNKPHVVTHRRTKFSIPEITESSVCLNNGLKFHYHDANLSCFVDNLSHSDWVPDTCTYQLPESAFALQPFLFREFEGEDSLPNEVIATQSDCPDHLGLEEYRCLAGIPVGYRLQWLNILRQLVSPGVDFKKPETSLVILQAIYQAGPQESDDFRRASHIVLADADFTKSVLSAVDEATGRIKENWESYQALSIFSCIVARQLSLVSSSKLAERALAVLLRLRKVSFAWLQLLRSKRDGSEDEDQRVEFAEKIVAIAMICAGTFDVDGQHLKRILSETENSSILIQCGMLIHELFAEEEDSEDPLSSILHHRWQRLSHRSHSLLLEKIVGDDTVTCLDLAVKSSWPQYRRMGCWETVASQSDHSDHWVVSKTDGRSGQSLTVHYNSLTGELLVNGAPLSRLPNTYEKRKSYRELFGHIILQIMPSSMNGMQFSSKQCYAGHALHFGLDGADMLVRATKDESAFELVPKRVFRGRLPLRFVEDMCHWWDITTNTVEFRSSRQPWASDGDTWTLSRHESGWKLSRRQLTLVNPSSRTGKRLSVIFAPLQSQLQLEITLEGSGKTLNVDLPRLKLGFRLKKKDSAILSRQFRGFEIDGDQSIDTLTGLKSKLVLRNPSTGDRRIIIPAGRVSFERERDHVSVHIDPSLTSTHVYRLDTNLGILRDNGSLQSKLFLCYLHAITSFCLPDGLTGSTGTEQALSILKSAAVKSNPMLTEENMRLLGQIEKLTPRRGYYPKHIQVMQTVHWNPELPVLGQHSHFHQCVMALWDQNELAQLYYPKDYIKPPEVNEIHPRLLRRDNLRSSTFRISGFGAEDFTDALDVTYNSRDLQQSSDRSKRAGMAAAMLFHRKPSLAYQMSCFPNFKSHLLRLLKTVDVVQGPLNSGETRAILDYDGMWLEDHTGHWAKLWCWLHQQSILLHVLESSQLMLWFATMAFSPHADMDIIQIAASMFGLSQMQMIIPPAIEDFRLREGSTVDGAVLEWQIQPFCLSFNKSPEANLPKGSGETSTEWRDRTQKLHEENQSTCIDILLQHLVTQWPTPSPTPPSGHTKDVIRQYVNLDQAMDAVRPKFRAWHENLRFDQYLERIDAIIATRPIDPLGVQHLHFERPQYTSDRKKTFISPADLFASKPPITIPDCPRLSYRSLSSSGLESLIEACESKANSQYETKYAQDLRASLDSLPTQSQAHMFTLEPEQILPSLLEHLLKSLKHSKRLRKMMKTSMKDGLEGEFALSALSPGPRLSPMFFLRQLSHGGWDSRDGWHSLPVAWKPWIVAHGLALTEVQRAKRLIQSLYSSSDLERELKNEGHTNWDAQAYPESLLLEVESDIMIREVQEQIAAQMRQPPQDQNAVMQLNMGEGKSSVIAPAVTAALADGSRLVRVIVAKPQSRQMFDMLVSKLGGLLNRQIFHLPFSRALQLTISDAQRIQDECKRCIEVGGVMLVQPEQILSFKLMGLELLITENEEVGHSLLQTQHLFDTKSRDLVDESDENLSVKFELIYTMGMQGPIEFAPERWVVIQQVLGIIREHVKEVHDALPLSIELHAQHSGSFPRFRLLEKDATEMLLDQVAQYICDIGFPGFPISRQAAASRERLLNYITQPHLSLVDIEEVERGLFWTETTRPYLLLLRGLFAGGILAFAFGDKRWRVNYGLDNTRRPSTKLSVPLRGKDLPTPRSEFSHPDVVIVLTCNCYYYGGLSDNDLVLAFDHLLKSDQADAEYQDWVRDSDKLPSAFRQLMGVNMKDTVQCKNEVFPSFRYAKRAIDYFLQFIVFPKEMREFPHKLSTSGWDIAAVKSHPTTGFSGTVDSREMLPLDMSYLALPEQRFTNAHVLGTLLRPENGVILLSPASETDPGHDLSLTDNPQRMMSEAETLLAVVVGQQDSRLRVILDVGAQILEMTNAQVATKWLEMAHVSDPSIQGAIFFDDHDVLQVIDTKGFTEPLRTSPYGEHLDECLVYLDEAHTRGTDLKLPQDYRAAVTLGAKLTKDRLAQACMRMRKLGQGQSVVFCIPQDIQTKIKERMLPEGETATDSTNIDISNVLEWAISETHIDTRKSMPLWAAQGKRFERQRLLWDEARNETGIDMTVDIAEQFLEDEAQTLEQRYRPKTVCNGTSPNDKTISERLRQIRTRCENVGSINFDEATLQEEQERELSPEVEEERQLERPLPANPAKHHLHEDLRQFVLSGVLAPDSPAIMPAFETLRETSAAEHIDVSMFPKRVVVTKDFARTVRKRKASSTRGVLDAYQRPVQWILTSQPHSWQHIVIISPYEAQELLPAIRSRGKTTLHIYAPRPNSEIRPLDGLDLYTTPSSSMRTMTRIPTHLKTELNTFAGQLYFGVFSEYSAFCEMLGLSWKEAREGMEVAADGFIVSSRTPDSKKGRNKSPPTQTSNFTKSPVKFMKVFLMTARRDCQSIEKTHVGKLLDGALLQESEFEI